MAAIAPVLFPEMKERGAKGGELVALLAATGAQTETIPPSLVLITIGSVTGVSIAALFTGGVLPAIVCAILLCFVVRRRFRYEELGHVERASRREIGRAFLIALPHSSCRSSFARRWSKVLRRRPKSRPSASPTRRSPGF
jgi:TRAP-type C4-dicarboxylate transport system permease large subunit